MLAKYKRKKERGQYSIILTEQDWSIKDLLNSQKENFILRPCGTNGGNAERSRRAEANQNARSWIQPYNKGRLIVLIDLSLRQHNRSSNQAVNTNSRENREVKKV